MGTLRERGTPFFGTKSTFAGAYPSVERAIVRFTETDAGENPRERIHDLADGPRAACGNPRCRRGGYDFQPQFERMLSQGIESEAVDMSCMGDEGTPKGKRKGQSCLMSIEGTITITYKKPTEVIDPTKSE
jgi:hypothetical protein